MIMVFKDSWPQFPVAKESVGIVVRHSQDEDIYQVYEAYSNLSLGTRQIVCSTTLKSFAACHIAYTPYLARPNGNSNDSFGSYKRDKHR